MQSSNLTLQIRDGNLFVDGDSYHRVVPVDSTTGFELKLAYGRPPARFYFMGGNIVHESEGVLRVVGTVMKLHLDKEMIAEDFNVLPPPELEPIAKDYVHLLATNLSHILTTVQQEAAKDWKHRYDQLSKTHLDSIAKMDTLLKNQQEFVERYEADLITFRELRSLLGIGDHACLTFAVRELINRNVKLERKHETAQSSLQDLLDTLDQQ
jgi:hypothetical protein